MRWPVIWDRLGTGGGRVAMDVWVCRCVGGQRVKLRASDVGWACVTTLRFANDLCGYHCATA